MFDIAPMELLLVVVVALVVIGPKDLPRAMRHIGKWLGKARAVMRHFRTGLDAMVYEAELEDLEKQWRSHNDMVMREAPRNEIDTTKAGTTEADTTKAGTTEADTTKAGTTEADTAKISESSPTSAHRSHL